MTIDARKQRIRQAFSAAEDYDRHAVIQRAAARRLGEIIGAQAWPAQARVLEIGCGTGFLTGELVERLPGGRWLLTDISAAMVERCRAQFGEDPRFAFRVLDGEAPAAAAAHGAFDLIASSLAAQWFADLPGSLERLVGLLAPGGRLAVATLTEGAFAEWRQAHAELGLLAGSPAYPSVEALQMLRPGGLAPSVELLSLQERHDDAFAFLRSLKAIGAGTPIQNRTPLTPSQLREVMRRFEAGGSAVTYEIALCQFTKQG